MDGVTILSSTTHYMGNGYMLLVILFGCFCFSFFMTGASAFLEGDIGVGIVLTVLFTLFTIGLIWSYQSYQSVRKNINYIEYKATISENVKLSDFNKKYEIVSKDGDLYTIRENTIK